MNRYYTIFKWLLLLAVTSCRTVPPPPFFDPPPVALDQVRKQAADNQLFNGDALPTAWWEILHDDQLNNLINKSLSKNPSLESARANILLALTVADSVRSSLFPNIVWGGDVSRQKLSETGVIPFGSSNVPIGNLPNIPVYFTQFETQMNLIYDFDLWGKNRNTLYAALGEVQAKVAEEAFTRLQLSVAVAKIYYELQTLYQREGWAKEGVNNRKHYLCLREKRKQQNLDNLFDITHAQTAVTEAENALLSIQRAILVAEHQLQAYLADQFEEKVISFCPQQLPTIALPDNLPMHLLSHRPDIQAQLWLIQSAARQIKVAQAAFYPDFNIRAFFGFQTIHFHELFRWPSSYFNVDPAFTLPIFDGGWLQANLQGSEVNYNLAVLDYNALVIQAVQETLDGITLLINSENRLVEYQKKRLIEEQREALESLRVQNSLDTYLDYLQIDVELLQAHDAEIQAHGEAIQAWLCLVKALGGGYECAAP